MKTSYDEFRKKVYEFYAKSLRVHDKEEVDAFFKSEDAESEMKNAYNDLKEKVESGTIDESVVLTGGAGGCAQCLVMMF